MGWKEVYESKFVTREEAAKLVESGDRIMTTPGFGLPVDTLNAVFERYEELNNVNIYSGLLFGPLDIMTDPKYLGHIEYEALFLGPVERVIKGKGGLIRVNSLPNSMYLDYLEDIVDINVTIAQCSEPDEDGYVYTGMFGVSIIGQMALRSERVILEVNKNQLKTVGEQNRIHVDDVTCFVRKDGDLLMVPETPPTEIEKKIASYIVPMIPDGATFQLGIGGLANAVAYELEDKKDLKVFTEMITNSMVHLAQKGVVVGELVGSFAMGSEETYDFATNSGRVKLKPASVTNNFDEIRKHDNFISVNNCLMVDLTGQVAAEAIGTRMVSAVGGSQDFVRGARASKGGKSFICMPSTSEIDGKRISNVAAALPLCTPVSVPRNEVMYIVTEYGVADLYCRSFNDRAEAMIGIAHPDFREELRDEAKKQGLIR